MKDNRRTKVNMVLSCEMERQNLSSGNVEILNVYFQTKTIINLEATDE
jgi:hypothetical protein